MSHAATDTRIEDQSWLTYQNYLAAKKAKQPTKALLNLHREAFDKAVMIRTESTLPHRHDEKHKMVFLS